MEGARSRQPRALYRQRLVRHAQAGSRAAAGCGAGRRQAAEAWRQSRLLPSALRQPREQPQCARTSQPRPSTLPVGGRNLSRIVTYSDAATAVTAKIATTRENFHRDTSPALSVSRERAIASTASTALRA